MKRFDLVLRLKKRLERELPGEMAHLKMFPSERRTNKNHLAVSDTPRASSVLILLYPTVPDEYPGTVLIKRATDNSVHSGQISFPGGKQDEDDLSAVHTALREAEEEIGIQPERIEVIGSLSPLYVSPSNFIINPVIGYVDGLNELKPNPYEVEQIIKLPLKNLETCHSIVDLEVRGFVIRQVPCFDINSHIVWGATAMILQELLDVLDEL